MILTINIGNTTTSLGVFDGEKLLVKWKIASDSKDINSYIKKLKEEFEKHHRLVKKIDGVIIGSVVPTLTPLVIEFVKRAKLPNVVVVNEKTILPITLHVDKKEEVGADIIADLIAANDLYSKPSVIIDSGTATTFSVLSSKGEFVGTVIAPGLELMAKSLFENTALLPRIAIEKPKTVIGTNTVGCMQSGVFWGYIGLLEGILKRIKHEYKNAIVIGTGGNITKIARETSQIDTIDENLTLKGLRIIYDLNTSL